MSRVRENPYARFDKDGTALAVTVLKGPFKIFNHGPSADRLTISFTIIRCGPSLAIVFEQTGTKTMKNPIDSRQLLVFSALAQNGSLRTAGSELHLTCSAISHSVHSLEENLGVKLFDRSGKTLLINELGIYLLRETKLILAHMSDIRSRLAANQVHDQACLRIAVGFNFVSHLLPDIVREWNLLFPEATLNVRAAERDACLGLLRSNEIDAAIMVDPPEDENLSWMTLFQDELKVVTSQNHPFALQDSVSLRSLHDTELLVSRMQSYTIRSVISEMQRQGVNFKKCIDRCIF